MSWTCEITALYPEKRVTEVVYTDQTTGDTLPDQFVVPAGAVSTYISEMINTRLSQFESRDAAFSAVNVGDIFKEQPATGDITPTKH